MTHYVIRLRTERLKHLQWAHHAGKYHLWVPPEWEKNLPSHLQWPDLELPNA